MEGFFLNPALLWGTLLVGVPVLIHLLTKRRFRRLPWAAMEFLNRAHQRTQKRLRVENLLLLAVRMALLALLAAALARPLLRRTALFAGIAPEGERNLALVIDNSYSMRSRLVQRTPFERALEQARKLLASLREGRGNRAVVIAAVRKGGQPVKEPLFHLESVRADLEAIGAETSYRPADLPEALEQALQALRKTSGRREVWLFTDLQRANLMPTNGRPGEDPSARLKELGAAYRKESTELRIVDVGPRSTENSGIADLRMDDRVATTAGELHFTASVRNHGERPAEAALRVTVGDPPAARIFTTERNALPPGRETAIGFTHHFKEKGFHAVRVELEPSDGLDVDDRRRLVVEVKERIQVLLVDGKPDQARFENGTDFLRAALDPLEEGGEDRSPFLPTTISDFNFERTRLDDYDVFALCDLPVLPAEKVRELKEKIIAGRGLLLFMGEKTKADVMNQTLGATGLLPVKLTRPQLHTGPVGASGAVKLGKVEFNHPVLKLFGSEQIKPLFLEIPYRGWFQCDPGPEDALVVARLGDPAASPWLAELRVGEGMVLWFNTTANRDWSSLPASPFFLPLVHEAATWSLAGAGAGRNLIVGRDLRRSFSRFPGEVTLRTPLDDRVRLTAHPREGEPGRFGVFYEATDVPGLYRLAAKEGGLPEELFAVNVEPSEGDLRRFSEREWKALAPDFPVRFEGSGGVAPADPGPRGEKGEIWKTLIGGVLVLLVVEMLLAWHFGKRLA